MRVAFLLSLIALTACKNTPKQADTDTADDTVAVNFALSSAFLNIGHRGGSALAPENTLEAMQAGLDAGADALEFDIQETADGELIILHDGTVDRTTDGSGAISSFTLAEVQALDAGYWYTTDGGATYPFRGQGVKVPTFAEVLEAFPGVWLDAEVKQYEPRIQDAVIEEIEAHNAQEDVFIACFNAANVKEIRQDYPSYTTNFATSEYQVFSALSEADEAEYTPPGQLLQTEGFYITEEYLARVARFDDLRSHVWTVNDEAAMTYYLDLGVDAIITDNPGTLSDVLAARAR